MDGEHFIYTVLVPCGEKKRVEDKRHLTKGAYFGLHACLRESIISTITPTLVIIVAVVK